MPWKLASLMMRHLDCSPHPTYRPNCTYIPLTANNNTQAVNVARRYRKAARKYIRARRLQLSLQARVSQPRQGAERAKHLLFDAYSRNTTSTYSTGWNLSVKFAAAEDINPESATDTTTKAVVNPSTASTYLFGVNYRLGQLDLNHNSAQLHKRRMILSTAKRVKRGQVGKQGLYHHDLKTELLALDADPCSTHGQYVSLAAILALCAGLRAMDYAPKASTTKRSTVGPGGDTRPPNMTMRRSALTFGRTSDGVQFVRVLLLRSKWWNQSVQFTLHETKSSIDCYRWLKWAYKCSRHFGADGHLFVQTPGDKDATYSRHISVLRKRVNSRSDDPELNLTPQRLRVATARSLLANVPRKILDGYLRWKSDAGDIYLKRLPQDFVMAMTPAEGRRSTELILGCECVHTPRQRRRQC
jgi:hypothetical protein